MIVWIASYPRSGNTFLRILLHHFSNLPTYHLYRENDSEVELDRGKLAGHEILHQSLHEIQYSSEIFFIKTHELPSDQFPAIYLVRDGRDVFLSYTKYIQNYEQEYSKGKDDTKILRGLISRADPFGGWSNNVLSWTQRTAPTVVIRFEYLINHPNPKKIIEYAFQQLDLEQNLQAKNEDLPTFQTLNEIEPTFFRSGKVGNWHTEMSTEMQSLFWRHHGYVMNKMGYSRYHPFSQMQPDFSDPSLLQRDMQHLRGKPDDFLTKSWRLWRLRYQLIAAIVTPIKVNLRNILQKLGYKW